MNKEITVKTEETLYIKILIWAYKKQETGFLFKDLKKEFGLNSAQEQWVENVFFPSESISENLIDRLSYNEEDNDSLFVIIAKGTSAAIEYLNLKEAERSSKRAEKIAKIAIFVGIIVGVFQIIMSALQLAYCC